MTTQTNLASAGTAPSQSNHLASDGRKEAFAAIFSPAYAKKFDDGIAWQHINFYTPAPKKFFSRAYAFLSRNLYAELVYWRYPEFDQVKLNRFRQLCTEKSKAVIDMLELDTARLRKICEDNGATGDDLNYLRSFNKEVPVIHPVARSYLIMLQKLDTLMIWSSLASMFGVTSQEQKRQVEMKARSAVTAFEGMVRSEAGRLRNAAAAAVAKSPEADTAAEAGKDSDLEDGSSTQDLRDAIQAQDAGIEAYDNGVTPTTTTEEHLAELDALSAATARPNKPAKVNA